MICELLYIAGVGVNPGTVGGYGVTLNKKLKFNQASCVLFHVKRVKVHCTESNIFNGTHVERVKRNKIHVLIVF